MFSCSVFFFFFFNKLASVISYSLDLLPRMPMGWICSGPSSHAPDLPASRFTPSCCKQVVLRTCEHKHVYKSTFIVSGCLVLGLLIGLGGGSRACVRLTRLCQHPMSDVIMICLDSYETGWYFNRLLAGQAWTLNNVANALAKIFGQAICLHSSITVAHSYGPAGSKSAIKSY